MIENNLMERPFYKLDKSEIERFCEAVWDCSDPGETYSPPFIDEKGYLVIPLATHPKYKWWCGGQSPEETIKELQHD